MAWTLVGSGGLTLEAISYGGIVPRLLVPDRQCKLVDMVLGLGGLEAYMQDRQYFGAIIGRVAGRLANACCVIDDEVNALSCNELPNHIHDGFEGFGKKLWDATPATTSDGEPSLRLAYRSADGEEGYPGSVDVAVTYTLKRDNTFLIETEAVADQATLVNLTHHSYFNFAGEGSGDVLDCADHP